MKRFQISFIANEKDVPTIFSLLSGHTKSFKVTEVDPSPSHPMKPQEGPRYDKVSHTDSGKLILNILRSSDKKQMHLKEIQTEIEKDTYKIMKPSSASPALTALVREGYVERVAGVRGTYKLKG